MKRIARPAGARPINLFFDVAEIIKRKKPKAIFLENVKGLRNHNGGKTLATILNVLRNDLDYFVPEPQIINAKDFGVPQQRERIYIVGFRKDQGITEFEYPKPLKKKVKFADVKEKKVPATKYFLSTQYVQTLINHKERHESKGNGFGYAIIPDDGIANSIVQATPTVSVSTTTVPSTHCFATFAFHIKNVSI